MNSVKKLTGLMALTGLLAGSAAAQQQQQPQQSSQGETRYQSVTPKKTPKPLDPADVATLTGRPVPREWNTAPRPAKRIQWYSDNPEQESDNALDPSDVDILTGKYDQKREPYRPYGWDALWAYEWVEGRGYVRRDSLFGPRVFGRDSRLFLGPDGRLRFHPRFRRPFFLHKDPTFFFLF